MKVESISRMKYAAWVTGAILAAIVFIVMLFI
jgi:hypothetical protein